MSVETQKNEVVELCNKLLAEDKVKVIIGFEQSDVEGITTPLFMRKTADVERLKWDDRCTSNLAKYLLEKRGKVGIIAKACDARAIVMYMVEKQIVRDDIYIIGMECPGMKKDDGTPSFGCEDCKVRIPPVYDVLVKYGEEIKLPDSKGESSPVENKDLFKRFQDEIDKCILCFSCRQACYGCYCQSCCMEMNKPNWSSSDINAAEKMNFHLAHAMHIAGRCVECGACERVCPSGVNIRYLITEINKFIKESYNYEAGIDPEATPALAVYNTDDCEVGMSRGEGH